MKRKPLSLAELKKILAARGITLRLGDDGRIFVVRGKRLESVTPALLRVLGYWKEELIRDLTWESKNGESGKGAG